MDRGVKQGVQGNCKTRGAEPNTPLFAYQWWGWGSCLLKPKWVWNVCSLLNDILTAYDETLLSQQSDRVRLYFSPFNRTVSSVSPDTLGLVWASPVSRAAVRPRPSSIGNCSGHANYFLPNNFTTRRYDSKAYIKAWTGLLGLKQQIWIHLFACLPRVRWEDWHNSHICQFTTKLDPGDSY